MVDLIFPCAAIYQNDVVRVVCIFTLFRAFFAFSVAFKALVSQQRDSITLLVFYWGNSICHSCSAIVIPSRNSGERSGFACNAFSC